MAEKAKEVKCESCNKTFKDAEDLVAHNKAKHPELVKERKAWPVKKIRNWGIFIFLVALIVLGIYYSISSVRTLPPIDIQGHVESSPPSHILKEPMPIPVQKHMLEHVDGEGRPGVVINYNCKDYVCEEGLIQNLESFALKYNYVYVAPFKKMGAKIALTKYGRIEIFDSYDELKIKEFIEG